MELMTQIKLAEQPNIMALLQTLEENRLNKEKQEVEALVNCLDSMEEQYGKILGEMQGIREELGKIGESQTKIQLSDITGHAEQKVQEFGEQLNKMKENLVKSAKSAMEQCKEKGATMLKKVVSGMKIPQAISKLEHALSKAQSGVEQQAIKAGAIRQELQSIGGHTKNVGKMLIGKEAKEIPADTASIGKVEKLLLRVVKRLEKMEQSAEKTRGKLEQFMTGKQKSSVKMELNQLKKQRTETGKTLALPDKSIER